MLEQCHSAKERWGGVSELIDRWLQERQDLLGRFVDIPQMELSPDVAVALSGFGEILVDYASSWHFGVYEHLLSEADQFNDGGAQFANKVAPEIQHTTDAILDFNDQYEGISSMRVQDVYLLSDRLSKLGEVLAERFELEDQLIERLHNAHRDRV